jgi:GH15 family glucan-1,4-alpha-glucosidase
VGEIIAQGVVRPQSALARGTLAALQDHLAMTGGSPGFKRNDDGTGSSNPYPWYDDQEWVVIDLRMAVAMHRVGAATGDTVLQDDAEALVDWVTALAEANHGLIPELLSDGVWQADDDADHWNVGHDGGSEFQGAVPMCGFGPGAYVLALEELGS